MLHLVGLHEVIDGTGNVYIVSFATFSVFLHRNDKYSGLGDKETMANPLYDNQSNSQMMKNKENKTTKPQYEPTKQRKKYTGSYF